MTEHGNDLQLDALGYALWYATHHGWRVFPTWSIGAEGACECPAALECGSPGKHPWGFGAPNGVNDATDDPDEIRDWWARYPNAGVAIACGRASGIVVVDLDPRSQGWQSLEEWDETEEPFPLTFRVRTGGGGVHWYFAYPEGVERIVGGNAKLGRGLDVKSDGGYVVAPPSKHASGERYRADVELGTQLAPLPLGVQSRLIRALSGSGSGGDARDAWPSLNETLAGVEEGRRNEVFFHVACRMRGRGLALEDVLPVFEAAALNCTPPFDLDGNAGVRDIVRRVWRTYRPNELDQDGNPIIEEADLEHPVHPNTDHGNALRFIDLFGHEFRYIRKWGRWLTWDGMRWREDDVNLALKRAREMALTIADDVPHAPRRERGDFIRWVKVSQSTPRLKACLEQASSDARVARRAEEFDADDMVINTRSGLLDLNTLKLTAHDPAYSITKLANGSWEDDSVCPRWLDFLARIVPDDEDRKFLQRAAGLSLTGDTSAKVMFILWGAGDNGKTVFLEVLRRLLGDYADSAAKSVFTASYNEQHPTSIASLRGLRFVTCGSEINRRDRLNTDLIKALTGGDSIKARFMRQDEFSFTPTCKLWLGTNHKPQLTDFGDAMRRRLRLIPFTVTIPKAEQIEREQMIKDLLREGAGILKWMALGLLGYKKVGLGETVDMAAAKEEWLEEEDVFGEFVEECILPREYSSDAVTTPAADVYQAYTMWAGLRGERRPLSQRGVASELSGRDYVRCRQRGTGARAWKLELKGYAGPHGSGDTSRDEDATSRDDGSPDPPAGL